MRWYYIMFIIFLTLIFLVFPFYRLCVVKAEIAQYTVFVDLLLILLGLAAAIGFLIWVTLENRMTQVVQRTVQENFSAVEGLNYISQGLMHHEFNRPSDAIRYTRAALLRKLAPKDRIIALNNLAYFLAERHVLEKRRYWQDKKEAEEAIESAIKGALVQAPDELPNFRETECFVKARFAENKDEAEKVKELIEKIKQSPNMTQFEQDLEESLQYLRNTFSSS